MVYDCQHKLWAESSWNPIKLYRLPRVAVLGLKSVRA